MTIKELHERLGKLLAQMRAINDKAIAEKRDLTSEETAEYENIEKEYDAGEIRLERMVKDKERENRMKSFETPEEDDKPKEDRKVDPSEIQSRAFDRFLRGGMSSLSGEEFRALQADVDAQAGYLVAPENFIKTLIKAVDDSVYMRGLATMHTVTDAQSLGAPSLENDPADPTWTAEIATGTEDSTMSVGKRELNPHPLAKLIKVSETLLRKTSNGAESLVRDRLAYKNAVTLENAYLNGSGSNQPLGVFTASSMGISTSYDVATDNTSTSISTDGLINAMYDLKEGYQRNATWMFHRDAVKQIRKLQDGNGEYIWLRGITADRPNTILDRPYIMSEYVPNTFTSGLYVGIVGDFKYYWIADALTLQIKRLAELYAETNQIGFISRFETDGMPVLGEAFRRVTLG